MSQQYIVRTYTDSLGEDFEMYEAQYATKGPATGAKWVVCRICGIGFKESQVRFSGGAAYCIPNGCYKDLL